jgi:prevent-host-death family protein
MRVPITEAKGQLTELVRRAEAGDEVVLTRHGQPAVRLVPMNSRIQNKKARLALLEEISRRGAANARPGPGAARSQDFLYGERGLPR